MSFASNFTVIDGIGDDHFFHDGRTVTPMIPTPAPSPYDYGGTYGGGWVGRHPYATQTSSDSMSRLSRTGLIILPILISVLSLAIVGLAVLLVYNACCVKRARNRSVKEQTKTFHNLRVPNGNEDAAGYPASYASTFAADGGGISSGGDFGAASSGGGCTSGDSGGGGACGI